MAFGSSRKSRAAPGATLGEKLRRPETRILVARNFVMDWSMLWKDLLLGFRFLIAGALSAFVLDTFWQTLRATTRSLDWGSYTNAD